MMDTSGQENQRTAPLLCANSCGFYGNPTTKNLCSKCYRDLIGTETQQQQQQSSCQKLKHSATTPGTTTTSCSALPSTSAVLPRLTPLSSGATGCLQRASGAAVAPLSNAMPSHLSPSSSMATATAGGAPGLAPKMASVYPAASSSLYELGTDEQSGSGSNAVSMGGHASSVEIPVVTSPPVPAQPVAAALACGDERTNSEELFSACSTPIDEATMCPCPDANVPHQSGLAPVETASMLGAPLSSASSSSSSSCSARGADVQTAPAASSRVVASDESETATIAASTSDILMASDSGDVPEVAAEAPVQVNKQRCFQCNKKIGLLGFRCRCDYFFCGTHRHADRHECIFDYKAYGRKQLAKANQKVVATKLNRI